MHDIVMRGGTILDGTGAEAFTGDAAVDDDKLTQIGCGDLARREIDADGLPVRAGR